MDVLGYIRQAQASVFIIHQAVHSTPLTYLHTLLQCYIVLQDKHRPRRNGTEAH